MTILLIIFLIYIIGCVLAFGRIYGEEREVGIAVFVSVFSWMGFFIGIGIYFSSDSHAFLKYPPIIGQAYRGVRSRLSRGRHYEPMLKDGDAGYDFECRTPETHSWR